MPRKKKASAGKDKGNVVGYGKCARVENIDGGSEQVTAKHIVGGGVVGARDNTRFGDGDRGTG